MIFNKKKLLGWIKILLLIYASAGIVLFYLQDKILFHPQKLIAVYQFKFKGPFEEVNIPFNEIDTMNLIKFLPDNKPVKGVVIYFHGNMKNIEHYATFADPFLKSGYEVWMEDYPGFGKSTGAITEQKLYEQALQVKKIADVKFHSDSIIIYGKSLGTGIAANVASRTKAKMLILETPYYSIPSLFSSYAFMYPNELMSNYKLPVYQFLPDIAYPVIIFHGTSDGVVPYRCAKKLIPVLKSTDEFITVKGASHNNLNATQQYFNAIDSLLK
jgi:alpha-beta hydrolase superfamily lysophospholipase